MILKLLELLDSIVLTIIVLGMVAYAIVLFYFTKFMIALCPYLLTLTGVYL